jgi:hypothetical protein
MTSEHETWKRETAIRKVAEQQDGANPPPLRHSFGDAPRFVGASIRQVEQWWQGRGV